MGRIANLVMALALTASLLWGGCLSCTQYFMSPARKSCCEPGKCRKSQSKPSAPEACLIQPMALKDAPAMPARTSAQVAFVDILPALALASTVPFRQLNFHRGTVLPDPQPPPDLCIFIPFSSSEYPHKSYARRPKCLRANLCNRFCGFAEEERT